VTESRPIPKTKALSAPPFPYRQVLTIDLPWMENSA
jgi:hypothetical protein